MRRRSSKGCIGHGKVKHVIIIIIIVIVISMRDVGEGRTAVGRRFSTSELPLNQRFHHLDWCGRRA